jgi:hypothetical protein
MRKVFSSILQDLKDGENVENYLIILISVIIAALNLIGAASFAVISSAILGVLSLVAYGQIKSSRLLKTIKQSTEIQGVTAFYSDRQNVPALEKRITLSTEEIGIMGLQLSAIIHNYLPLLTQQALKGCRIKLLMMSPTDESGIALPWVEEVGKVHTFLGLRNMLNSNIEQLSNWYEELPATLRKQVEIKLFPTIPTVSTLFIDKDSDSGLIKVEPILHKFPPSQRPSFVVNRYSAPALYKNLVGSFDDLWLQSFKLESINGKGGISS